MVSQLPCLGVRADSKRSHSALNFSGARLIQRARGVRVQIVHDQRDALGIAISGSNLAHKHRLLQPAILRLRPAAAELPRVDAQGLPGVVTAALIGSKREATALVAVREVARLRDELGFSARHGRHRCRTTKIAGPLAL